MHNHLVSVIVPVYNVEKYLDNCILSLIKQTYQNIEIILVDDGSKDSSGDICERYSKSYSNIKTFHKDNGGLSDARNFGLHHISGEFVTFVDSDDYVSIYFIEELVNAIFNTNSDIAVCNYQIFVNEEDVVDGYSKEIITFNNTDALIDMMYQKRIQNSAWGKLYKTFVVKDIEFPKGQLYEDLSTVYKYFEKASTIVYINNKLYYYRNNPNGIMNRSFDKHSLDLFRAVNEIEEHFATNSKIIKSVRSRKFSAYSQLIGWMPHNYDIKTNNFSITLRNYIKDYRNDMIFDKNARLKNRLAAILSYLGKNIFYQTLKKIYY